MPSVAEQLRRAREAQKLDIYQVAEITKIKSDHIRALESGNYETFSAPIYIRGFVRSYARVLKLDISRVGADLDEELGQNQRFRDPPPLTNQPRGALDFVMLQLSKLTWRSTVAILAVVLVLILAGTGLRKWVSRGASHPLKNLGPGLHTPANNSGEVLPLPAPRVP